MDGKHQLLVSCIISIKSTHQQSLSYAYIKKIKYLAKIAKFIVGKIQKNPNFLLKNNSSNWVG
jgi:hypothetical protein